MIQRLWVPGPLPGLNEILNAKGNTYRRDRSQWTGLKQKWCGLVALYASQQRIQPIKAAWFRYSVKEPNRKRDPSNVICGAIKIIEDGLQKAKLLKNDGWENVLGIVPAWEVDRHKPGVLVEMESEDVPDL